MNDNQIISTVSQITHFYDKNNKIKAACNKAIQDLDAMIANPPETHPGVTVEQAIEALNEAKAKLQAHIQLVDTKEAEFKQYLKDNKLDVFGETATFMQDFLPFFR